MVKKKTCNVLTSIILTMLSIGSGVTVFILSYMRLIESVRDLGLSLGYYFCEIFGITHNITPTVCEKSGIKNELFFNISFDELKDKSVSFFTLLADKNNITGWLNYLGGKIGKILKVLAVVLPCLFISVLLLKLTYARGNNKHNKDTLPLKMFKNLTNVIYVPVRKRTSQYVSFLKERKWLLYLWGVIWFVNLNKAVYFV